MLNPARFHKNTIYMLGRNPVSQKQTNQIFIILSHIVSAKPVPLQEKPIQLPVLVPFEFI